MLRNGNQRRPSRAFYQSLGNHDTTAKLNSSFYEYEPDWKMEIDQGLSLVMVNTHSYTTVTQQLGPQNVIQCLMTKMLKLSFTLCNAN